MPTIMYCSDRYYDKRVDNTEGSNTIKKHNDIPYIKSLNIDVIQWYNLAVWDTDENCETVFDECYRNGLKIILALGKFMNAYKASHPTPDWDGLEAFITKWKDHPAMYGWNLDDEGANLTTAEKEQAYTLIKSLAPNTIITETGWDKDNNNGNYTDNAHDMMCWDPYPYTTASPYGGSNEAAALSWYSSFLTSSLPLLTNETKRILVMQAHGDPSATEYAWPPETGAYQEMWNRGQSTGFNTGHGVAFYTWYRGQTDSDARWFCNKDNETWAALREEIQTLCGGLSEQLYSEINSITLTKDKETASIGETIQFTATAYDAESNARPAVFEWSVVGNATIDQDGLLTVTGAGNFTVTATDLQDDTKAASVEVANDSVVTEIYLNTRLNSPMNSATVVCTNINRPIYSDIECTTPLIITPELAPANQSTVLTAYLYNPAPVPDTLRVTTNKLDQNGNPTGEPQEQVLFLYGDPAASVDVPMEAGEIKPIGIVCDFTQGNPSGNFNLDVKALAVS